MTNNEYKAKCQWLAEFYAEAARTGRWMQYYSSEKTWVRSDWGPTMESRPDEWRLKPEPQKAWVVWDDSGVRGVFKDYDEAGKHCEIINGVFHEITRPEPK